MKLRKIAAFLIAIVMVISFAACDNNKKVNEDTTSSQGETVANTVQQDNKVKTTLPAQDTAQPDGEPVSEKDAENSEDGSSVKPIDTKNGLNSTDTKTVLDFYKFAATKTDTIDATQHMSIESIDFAPKNDFQKSLLSLFRGLADVALKANSTPRTDVPGFYQNLETGDLNSANAIVSDNYTIVTLNVKSQEETEDTTDWESGPVGHAVGTLGDFSLVLEAFKPAISFDHSAGDVTLRYDNCKVVVKINNKTGKIETGTWGYTVNVTLNNIYADFADSDNFWLNNMGGSVKFDVKTNDHKEVSK
ncbi:MAG: hypothetical protein IJF40_03415 [Clostridia bacterium]|nr:hypothetical protein [Clostridia bacterium]